MANCHSFAFKAYGLVSSFATTVHRPFTMHRKECGHQNIVEAYLFSFFTNLHRKKSSAQTTLGRISNRYLDEDRSDLDEVDTAEIVHVKDVKNTKLGQIRSILVEIKTIRNCLQGPQRLPTRSLFFNFSLVRLSIPVERAG